MLNYIIFGTGDMSRKVLSMLEVVGTEPEYFVDNYVSCNSTVYNEYKVYHPDNLRKEKNVSVIVSVLGNEEIIRIQLKEMKLDPTIELIYYSDIALRLQNQIGRSVLYDAWRTGVIK